MNDLITRPAAIEDSEALTTLALRSKAYWGYSNDFLEKCRNELTVTPDKIRTSPVTIVEQNAKVLGYFALSTENNTTYVDHFFIEPTHIGQGVGRRLWNALNAEMEKQRINSVKIVSDPYAENFYLKMGAKRIGLHRSTLRELPLLEYTKT